MGMMKILVCLFVLVVGKTPHDRQEFAQLRGAWRVVKMETHSKTERPAEWRDRTVLIAAATETIKPMRDAIRFSGRLDTKGKPPAFAIQTVSIVPSPPRKVPGGTELYSASSPPQAIDMQVLYVREGDTLKLLVTPLRSKKDPRLTRLVPDAAGRSMLLTLRRKG